MTILSALGRFEIQLAADGRSIHTIGQYRRHVRAFDAWAGSIGVREIDKVTHEHVAKFLASPAARSTPDGRAKKATSTNALRTSLKVFFAFVHGAGYSATNAGRLIRRAITSGGPPRTMAPEEQGRLLDTLAKAEGYEAERDHALFRTMLATGIRVGSVVNLEVEDVDLNAGEITIHTKGDRIERVFLGKEIADHLRCWIADRTTGPLFPTRDGRRLTARQVARRLAGWIEKAAISRRASPHTLRHSFAMQLYRKTGDILLVREALRHRSIASTLVYARVDGERLRRAMG
jgi:integrase/recombinase XerC